MAKNRQGSFLFSNQLKLNIFNCVTCCSLLVPPVILIEEIGNVCGKCSSTIHKHSKSVPNKTLDHILNNLIVSCKYASYGCQGMISLDNLSTHQKSCSFSPVNCLENNCIWVGKKEELPKHFKEDHMNKVIENTIGKFKFYLDLETAKDFIQMLVLNEKAVYFLSVEFLSEDLTYSLYKMNDDPRSTVLFRHQTLEGKIRTTEAESDILPLNDFYEGRKGTSINILSLKTVLNSDSNILLIIVDFVKTDALTDKIINGLQCPCCFVTMRPPISQCSSGHSVCSICVSQLNECPVCRGNFRGKIRNFALETITEQWDYPCTYQTLGCEKVCKGAEIEEHEMQCSLKTYPCPMRCDIGNLSFADLKVHFEAQHNDVFCQTNSFKVAMKNGVTGLTLEFRTKFVLINNIIIIVFFYIIENCCKCQIQIVGSQNAINIICKVGVKRDTEVNEICRTERVNSEDGLNFTLLNLSEWYFKGNSTLYFQVEDQTN